MSDDDEFLRKQLEKLRSKYDCNVLEQYAKYPYLDYSPIVVSGYLSELQLELESLGRICDILNTYKISEICLKFYFQRNEYALQMAYEIWKTRGEIYLDYVNDSVLESHKFSGLRLINHIKHYLTNYSMNKNDQQIISMCNDLLRFKFITNAKNEETEDGARENESNEHQDDEHQDGEYEEEGDEEEREDEYYNKKDVVDKIWYNNPGWNDKYIINEKSNYKFKWYRQRQFIKLSQPDRTGWTRGTKVQIYSFTFNGWQNGTVLQINHNLLTVAYGPPHSLINSESSHHYNGKSTAYSKRKIVHRYDDEKLQSSDLFIENRVSLKLHSKLQIYSQTHRIWCNGEIIKIMNIHQNNVFRVSYSYNSYNPIRKNYEIKNKIKYVHRWSPHIRLITETDDEFNKAQQQALYQKGTKIKVYSNTEKKWLNGIIEDTVPAYQLINVRYGKSEKLLHINSHQFRLVNNI